MDAPALKNHKAERVGCSSQLSVSFTALRAVLLYICWAQAADRRTLPLAVYRLISSMQASLFLNQNENTMRIWVVNNSSRTELDSDMKSLRTGFIIRH